MSLDYQFHDRYSLPNVTGAIESNNLSRMGLVPDLGQQNSYMLGLGVET
jgi:hypothetical protein